MQDKQATPVVGYIRVSSVNGRGGESFISPSEQKRAIEGLAKRDGLEVVSWKEELDESGGRWDRPKWQEALAMVERGDVGGVAVWNLKRFSRSALHALQALERVEKIGGRLYSASEDFDASNPAGRAMRTTMFAFAEMERDQAREAFDTAQRNAVERGVWVFGHVPFGYRKDPQTKRLVVEPTEAAIVRRVFEMRADGASATTLARYVAEQGYSKNHASMRDWVKQRAYLGEVRSRGYVNVEAHTAIVSEELFDRANVARGIRPVPTGKTQAMLKSLVRCAGCGAAMLVRVETKDSKAAYYCRGSNIGGCSNRAYAKLAPLDAYVDGLIAEALDAENVVAEAHERNDRLEEATSVLAQAEAEYAKLKSDTSLLAALGEDAAEVVANAKARVDLARIERANAANAAGMLDGFNGSLRDFWPSASKSEKREILHGLIGEVRVRKGREPLPERVTLLDRDGDLLFERDFITALGEALQDNKSRMLSA
jgi:DNA invertase Pin-like site-specific DNA recombinase